MRIVRPKIIRVNHTTIPLLHKVIGQEATRLLTQSSMHRGLDVFIPKGEIGRGDAAFSALSEVAGIAAARKLCKHFGGCKLYVPKDDKRIRDERNRRIVTSYNQGKSIPQLAAEFDLTGRQIANVLKKTDMSDASQETEGRQ